MTEKKKPAHWNRDPIALTVRGTPAWRAWLGRYAASIGSTMNDVVERAVAEAAARDGFAEPPPWRLSGSPNHPPKKSDKQKDNS